MHLRMRVLYRRQVRTFIEKQCFASHKLVVCNYIKGGEPTVSRDEWAWQPLDFTHPTNDQRFELPLRWDNGTIGLFTVECGIFTPMDEELITLLHTVARMLEDAIKDLEDLELGTKPPLYTAIDVLEVYEKRKRGIAKILEDRSFPILIRPCGGGLFYCMPQLLKDLVVFEDVQNKLQKIPPDNHF